MDKSVKYDEWGEKSLIQKAHIVGFTLMYFIFE